MISKGAKGSGELLPLLILFGVVVIIAVITYIVLRVRAAGREREHGKHERFVRYLMQLGFVLCDTGGMFIWPLDLELEETKNLRKALSDPAQNPLELSNLIDDAFQNHGFCGIVSNHVVRFSRKTMEMFSSEEGPPRLEIYVYLDQLNNHKNFDSKLSLEHYCGVEPEEGASPFDTGNKEFDSFFSNRVGSSRAAKLFQSAGPKLDGVTRFIAKWSDRLDYARVGNHVRLGLPAGVVLDAEDPEAVMDEIMKDSVELAVVFERVLDPDFVANEHPWVDSTLFARVEVLTSCPKCNAGMPLNGPVRKQQCSQCLSEVKFDDDLWDMLKTPREDFLEGAGSIEFGFGKGSTSFNWKLESPCCPKCGSALPVETAAVGTTGVIRCAKCGAEISTYPAPDWLLEVAPGVQRLYDADGAPHDEGLTTPELDQKKAHPVGMNCPGCGGGLVIKSAAERTIKCEYCGIDVFIPDALWRKLHPAKVTRPWWVRLSPLLPS